MLFTFIPFEINRFSEDLDLYIDTNDPTSGQNTENALNSKVYNKVINTYPQFKSNLPNTATGGTRRIHFETNKMFTPVDIKNHLLIELSITTTKRKAKTYHPWVICSINSLVMEYLESVNNKIASNFENTSFKCKCISPKETICAKISRLTRTSRNPEIFATKIRDLYDLTKLLEKEEYVNFLNSDEFLNAMFMTNMQDWLQHKRIHTQTKYSESPLFAEIESLLSNTTVKNAYTEMQHLLFKNETLPSIENVKKVIEKIKKRIIEFENFNETKKDEYIYAEFNNYFKENLSDEISIIDYEFLKSLNKITGRLCHITKNNKEKTLSIDYETGDICITPNKIKKNFITSHQWKTIDGKPAYCNDSRIVSAVHKYLLGKHI